MTNPDDIAIPEEILRSEQKLKTPPRPSTPGPWGLPGLPVDIIDLLLKYVPWAVLASASLSGLSAVTMFSVLGTSHAPATAIAVMLGAITLATALGMGLSYVWLTQKRRLGWYALAVSLGISLLGQLVTGNALSLLSVGVEFFFTVYVMQQIRDYYKND